MGSASVSIMRLSILLWALGAVSAILLAASAHSVELARPHALTAPAQKQAAKEFPKLPDEVTLADGTKVERGTPKPGDICISCNHPVGDRDAVFIVRGHRLPIHLSEIQTDVGAQLSQLVGRLEPQSALFQVSERNPARSILWLLAGSYILMALIFAALSSQRALMKGHSPSLWLALGLVFHVFAYAVLLALPERGVEAPAGIPKGLKKIAATHQPVPCPNCGQLNHPSATKCIGCGGTLVARISSEVGRAGLRAG